MVSLTFDNFMQVYVWIWDIQWSERWSCECEVEHAWSQTNYLLMERTCFRSSRVAVCTNKVSNWWVWVLSQSEFLKISATYLKCCKILLEEWHHRFLVWLVWASLELALECRGLTSNCRRRVLWGFGCWRGVVQCCVLHCSDAVKSQCEVDWPLVMQDISLHLLQRIFNTVRYISRMCFLCQISTKFIRKVTEKPNKLKEKLSVMLVLLSQKCTCGLEYLNSDKWFTWMLENKCIKCPSTLILLQIKEVK
jgi:hypothetical protein